MKWTTASPLHRGPRSCQKKPKPSLEPRPARAEHHYTASPAHRALPKRTGHDVRALRFQRLLCATVATTLVTSLVGAATTSALAGASGTASAPLLPASGQFVSVTPFHLVDTRTGLGLSGSGPLSGSQTIYYDAEGAGGVPSNGIADVYISVTALAPSISGCIVDYSDDGSNPGICNVSFQSGQTVTNTDVVPVGNDGYSALTNQSSGTVGVAITVLGYFTDGSAGNSVGDTYQSLPETSVLDTRSGIGAPHAQIPAGGSVTVSVAGVAGVPADAAGVAAYIGAANASTSSDVSAFPAGSTDPHLSELTYQPGEIDRDLYMGNLGSAGDLTLANEGTSPVDLILNVIGYFVSPSASEAGSTFVSVPSFRILDTRNTTSLAANASVTFTATGADNIPTSGVAEVAESIAALSATASGYLSVYPAGTTDLNQPAVNFTAGDKQDNDLDQAVVAQLSQAGGEVVTNHSSGTVDVVVDARGYFGMAQPPAGPDLVSGSITGTTGTVTWQRPVTDGGAAITGYTVTIYDSNDSVVGSGTYGGTTTSATFPGLVASSTYTVDVAATNAVGSSDEASASMTAASPAQGLVFSSGDGAVSFNTATGSLTTETADGAVGTLNSAGQVTSSTDDPATVTTYGPTATNPQATSGFECVINVQKNSNLKFDGSWNYQNSGNSWTILWINDMYHVDDARYNSHTHTSTYQSMICSVGIGSVHNKYHEDFVGNAVFFEGTNQRIAGYKSGVGTTTVAHATSELNFKLDAGVAEIGGSTDVTAGSGTLSGDPLADGRFNTFPSKYAQWNTNRWNEYWHSPDTWTTDGTASPEGNSGEVLYEWPEPVGTLSYHDYGEIDGFCADWDAPLGCPSYN
jgi:hypothetical protein